MKKAFAMLLSLALLLGAAGGDGGKHDHYHGHQRGVCAL